jgi:hypothetical protein
MRRNFFYSPDEIKRAGHLAVADGEADERVTRPWHGAQDPFGYFFERSAQILEVGVWAEIPGLGFPEALYDLLSLRIKKSRIAGFREPSPF